MHQTVMSHSSPAKIVIVEKGVPQAYVRARASSAALCSVHVLRLFLCISDTYQNGLGYIPDTRIQTRTPLSRYAPYDYSN